MGGGPALYGGGEPLPPAGDGARGVARAQEVGEERASGPAGGVGVFSLHAGVLIASSGTGNGGAGGGPAAQPGACADAAEGGVLGGGLAGG